jgi:hypothetical protein
MCGEFLCRVRLTHCSHCRHKYISGGGRDSSGDGHGGGSGSFCREQLETGGSGLSMISTGIGSDAIEYVKLCKRNDPAYCYINGSMRYVYPPTAVTDECFTAIRHPQTTTVTMNNGKQ